MTEELSEADLKATDPSGLVKMAAALQGITGVLVALSGVQPLDLVFRSPVMGAMPWVFIAGGLLQLFLAAMVFRARVWAAFSAAALGGLMALSMIGWLFYTFPDLISCLQMIGTPISVLSAILAVLAIGGVRETAAARQRLSDQGMSLGL